MNKYEKVAHVIWDTYKHHGSRWCELEIQDILKKYFPEQYTTPSTNEIPEKLRFLADWFDKKYKDAGKNDKVQRDLRRFADEYEKLIAENEKMRKHLHKIHWSDYFG